jgi:rhodanese-related sulfurtransferase
VFYRLASGDVFDLFAAVRRAAEQHVAAIERLAGDYLGDRSDLEVVSRAELLERIDRGEVTVLDVRPDAEYEAGHIAGARLLPLERLRQHLRTLSKNDEVVAYCRGQYCVYADEAVRFLRRRGFRARRLEDGFPEWKRAGFPVADGTGG